MVLQIGATLGIVNQGEKITNRSKEISNCGRDYKSGQEGFQIGTRFTNRCGGGGMLTQLKMRNNYNLFYIIL